MADWKEIEETIGAIILGVLGGLAAASIANWLSGPKCPICKNKVSLNSPVCPHCNTFLKWR